MQKISEAGIAIIKQFEGFSEKLYICSAGKKTIGYGHVILDGEQFEKSISKKDAELLLKKDVAKAEEAVRRLAERPLTQNQFDALVSFVFNVGEGAFEKSTLLRCVNSGLMAEAARQFSRWVYAKGQKLPGLATRRDAEAQLFIQE